MAEEEMRLPLWGWRVIACPLDLMLMLMLMLMLFCPARSRLERRLATLLAGEGPAQVLLVELRHPWRGGESMRFTSGKIRG